MSTRYYECLHRSFQTFCDSISIDSSSSLQKLSKSRVVALIQNVHHELCQLQTETNHSSINYQTLLQVPTETVKYASVTCQIIFQIICFYQASLSSTESKSDYDLNKNLIAACIECLSVFFGSFEHSIIFEIFRLPIWDHFSTDLLHSPQTILPFDLLYSILTPRHTDKTINTSKHTATPSYWYTSKVKTHAMLIIFRALHATELVHRCTTHSASNHSIPDKSAYSTIHYNYDTFHKSIGCISLMVVDFLSRGNEGWNHLDNGHHLALESMSYLSCTIRCNFSLDWIYRHNDSNEDNQKQQFQRFILVLDRYTKQCNIQTTSSQQQNQTLELTSLSLSILLDWKSNRLIMDGFKITERLVEKLIDQMLEDDHQDFNDVQYQALYNLGWTRNDVLTKLFSTSTVSIRVQEFIFQQLTSSTFPSILLIKLFQIMELASRNQFRKLLYNTLVQIGAEHTTKEQQIDYDQTTLQYGNQKILSYLGQFMFNVSKHMIEILVLGFNISEISH